jgi:carboxylesterase type B
LNIFVPKTNSKKLLPVFVYIHGGNFIQGNPGSSLFQGQNFAEKSDTIVVTISYRLGAFVKDLKN